MCPELLVQNKKKTVLISIRDDRLRPKIIVLGSAEKVLNGAKAFGIGHLYSIAQPSSAKPARQTCNYPMLHQLTDLIPVLEQFEDTQKYA